MLESIRKYAERILLSFRKYEKWILLTFRKYEKWILLTFLPSFLLMNFFIIYLVIQFKYADYYSVSPRPVFLMVPFAFATYFCFGITLISGILYLIWRKDIRLDLILLSSAQVGVMLGAITIIIGMMWAKVEWGAFWDWNPRETITLIMWLIYVGLLIFRDMLEVDNHERRATISAIFGILAFVSIPLSYFIVGIIHPNPSETGYSTGAGVFLMINFVFISAFAIFLILQAYRTNRIEFELQRIRKIKMEEA